MALPPSSENKELGPLDRQNVVGLQTAPASQARRILWETIETIVMALILFVAINFVSARIRVDGSSMEPTFHDGDYVVVNRLAYKLGDIQRGDVIVFPPPQNTEVDYIKRVVGLPGDHISVLGGTVYLNNHAISETYLFETPVGNYADRIVPEGSVFVMGDNRNHSEDSRNWGFLSIDVIIGKAIFRYWPFNMMGVVQHPLITIAAPQQ